MDKVGVRMKISYLNGPRLYKAIKAGGRGLALHQQELNRINVFPVPDGDTGNNMASTLMSIIDRTTVTHSISQTAKSIADAALAGARGNSGMILAQFFQGISESIGEAKILSAQDFVRVVRQGAAYLYQCVSDPVEGTILTVIRVWADSLPVIQSRTDDFVEMLSQSRHVAGEALEQTTNRLGILQKHGVVDAGAKGFVYFLDAIAAFIENGEATHAPEQSHSPFEWMNHELGQHVDLQWRYCMEALVTEVRDLTGLKRVLEQAGDSVIVGGSVEKTRIHLHTNEPANVLRQMRRFGNVTWQKVDDMLRQYETIHQRKARIALVTDSTCDVSQELIDRYQIHVVPLTIQADGIPYLDKVTITPDDVYSLMDESEHYPTTSQPPLKTFVELYSHLVRHYDSVIAIHVSQALSGTYETSRMAARQVQGKEITVINSRHLSGTLGLLVLQAAEAIDAGKSHQEVVEEIEQLRQKSHILVSVSTLHYMVKGGRVSPLKGWMAKRLNLKPIVSLNSKGESILYGKAFTSAANRRKIMKMLRELHQESPIYRYVMLHAHAEDKAREYAREIESWLGKKPVYTVDISPVIGLHAGIGAVSVAMIQEK